MKVPRILGHFKGINSLLSINNDVCITPVLETRVDPGNDGEISPIHVLWVVSGIADSGDVSPSTQN